MDIIKSSSTKARRIAAVGMYDGVHRGHQFLIDYLRLEAVHRGLRPAVVTFKEHPRMLVRPLEAPAMLTELDDRLRLLSDTGIDDCILLTFNDRMRRMPARKFLGMLHDRYGVDALVVGFNNRFGRDRTDGFDQYVAIGKELGMEVMGAPEFKGERARISSSIVRGHLYNGAVLKATQALGRPYRLRGMVVEGKRLGRQLGFPTANIKPSNERALVPRAGVYAVVVTTPDGVRHPAMLNIGYRPTVDPQDNAQLTIEVNILGYTGYLYGEELLIDFIDLVRQEKKFKSLDRLKDQLQKDARSVRRIIERHLAPKAR